MTRKILPVFALLLALAPARLAAQVCAEVKLEIVQEATLEREAFDAKMALSNNYPDKAIENLKVSVVIKDANGNPADARFFVKVSTLQNITGGIGGAGLIQATTQGVINWLIIPSTGAGGGLLTGEKYSVSAAINYTAAGVVKIINTFSDTITVKPQPVLKLEYLLPFEVFGNEPLTPELEPIELFALAVRVTNIGFGTAKDFKIDSGQPEIVDNDQGLAIDFKLLGTYVGDKAIPNSLLVPFGDIGPDGVSNASWIMSTTLSGKFKKFDATFSHAAELGGQLTSLIQDVTTYTLIKDVLVDLPGRDSQYDFLVNTATPRVQIEALVRAGQEVQPDAVFESDQSLPIPVVNKTGVLSGRLSGTNSSLMVTVPNISSNLWVHVSIPLQGEWKIPLISVKRKDGKNLSPRNYWIAKHFDIDSRKYSYSLHLLDLSSETSEYVFTFDPSAIDQAPGAVVNMTASQASSTGSIKFDWGAPGEDGDTGDILGGRYIFQLVTNPAAEFKPETAQINFATNTIPGNLENYTATGLIGNVTYYARMWMQDTGGSISGISNGTTMYVLPNPPNALAVLNLDSATLEVSWRIGNNNMPVVYEVMADTEPLLSSGIISPVFDSFVTSFTFVGLLPNSTYFISGRSFNPDTLVSSVYTDVITTVTAAAPPSLGNALFVSSDAATFGWQPGANPVWTEYFVQLSTAADWSSLAAESGWVGQASYVFSGLTPDTTYYVRAKARNSAGLETAFADLGVLRTKPVDSLPPVTSISFSTPSFGVEPVYVSSLTGISLTGYDDMNVLGDRLGAVATVYYSVDSDTFTVYVGSFSITAAGAHLVRYYSADLAGNTEAVKTSSVTADDTTPLTMFEVEGSSHVIDGKLYIVSSSSLVLSASDELSGVKETYYSLDGSPAAAAPPVFLQAGTGEHTLTFYSVDNVGNAEAERSVTFVMEAKAPVVLGNWKFDEGAGTMAGDSSGNNIHGTFEGGASWTDYGKVDAALSLDGSRDTAVRIADSELLNNEREQVSLEAWIKINTQTDVPAIIKKGFGDDPSAQPPQYSVYWTGGRSFNFGVSDTENNQPLYSFTGEGDSLIGQWTHIVATYDKEKLHFYLNGQELGTGEPAYGYNIRSSVANLQIGGAIINGQYDGLNGLIDEVSIYDRALSSAEVAALYNSYGAKFSSPRTSATITGTQGSDGWYSGTVFAALTAVDRSGTGIKELRVCADQTNSCMPIIGNFETLSHDGINYLRYQSLDNLGKLERLKTEVVKIDNTAPETEAFALETVIADGATVQINTGHKITLRSTDTLSGVASVLYVVDAVFSTQTATAYTKGFTLGIGTHTVYYSAVDNVGNIAGIRSAFFEVTLRPPPGVLGRWKFDEGTGTIAGDSSGNNIPGTLHGAVWTPDAKAGGALSFDGSRDTKVRIADSELLNREREEVSLEAWFKINSQTFAPAIIKKGYFTDEPAQYSIYWDEGRHFIFSVSDIGNNDISYNANGAGESLIGQWAHIVATYDKTMLHFYLNGEELGTGEPAYGFNIRGADANLQIGGGLMGAPYEGVNGLIDEVSIYDRALSSSEVTALYNSYIPGSTLSAPVTTATLTGTEGPYGWYSSTVSVVLTAKDTSGSGVKEIRVCTDQSDSCTPVIGSSITISEDGINSLRYQSIGNNGALEDLSTATIKIDKSAPVTALFANGVQLADGAITSITPTERVTLTASDNGVGLMGIYYVIDAAFSTTTARTYVGPFTMAGTHTVYYSAMDNLGKLAEVKSGTVSVEMAGDAGFYPAVKSINSILWQWDLVEGATAYQVVSEAGDAVSAVLPGTTTAFLQSRLLPNIIYSNRLIIYLESGVNEIKTASAVTLANIPISVESFVSGQSASMVIGQPGFYANSYASGPSGLGGPEGVAMDAGGNMWVADRNNYRVLRFSPPFFSGMSANLVIGQTSLYLSFEPSNLYLPESLAFDHAGNLWVADGGRSRILRFSPPFSTGMDANLVLGSPDHYVYPYPQLDKRLGGSPLHITFDSNDNLWVSDGQNHRALRFLPPFVNNMSANLVLGQADLFSRDAVYSPPNNINLFGPGGIAVDSEDNLWVADTYNARVLKFEKPVTNGQEAALVIGQPDFNSNDWPTFTAPPTQNHFDSPMALNFDPLGNLFVLDGRNSRVLRFKPPFANGMDADTVIGQSNFTSRVSGTTPFNFNGLWQADLEISGFVFTDSHGRMWVSDTSNNRVLLFESGRGQTFSQIDSTSFNFKWDHAFNPDTTVYQAEISVASDFSSGVIESGYVNSTEYTFTGLQHGTLYYARVKAKNQEGIETAYDYPGSMPTRPEPASDFTGTARSSGSIEWGWFPPSQYSGYQVFSSTGGPVSGVLEQGASRYLQTGLSPNTTYSCFVRSVNKGGFSDAAPALVTTHAAIPALVVAVVTGQNADIVLGQNDFNSRVCSSSGNGLCYPSDVVTDGSGNLWVVDRNNGRIVEYEPPFIPGKNAALVLNGYSYSSKIAFDPEGHLWVMDQGNRVLMFNPPFTTGMNADLVIGQVDFDSSSSGDTLDKFSSPSGIAFDPAGNLWVSDSAKIKRFSPPFMNGMYADLYIEQHNINDLSFDTGGNLWVTQGENKVLKFVPPFSAGMTAALSVGADSPETYATTRFINRAGGVALEGTENLYVVDMTYRVLLFRPPFSGVDAAAILGQDFYAPRINSLFGPSEVSIGVDKRIWVADTLNNRVVGYRMAPFVDVSSNAIVMKWEDTANPIGTQYRVEASKDILFPAITTQNSAWLDISSFTIGGLEPDTKYHLRLKARNQEQFDGEPLYLGSVGTLAAPASYSRSGTIINGSPEVSIRSQQQMTVSLPSEGAEPVRIAIASAAVQNLLAVGNVYEVGPDGEYNPPALLTFHYSTSAVAALEVPESELAVYEYFSGTGWRKLDGQILDTVNKKITVPIPRVASLFGIFINSSDIVAPVTDLAFEGPAFKDGASGFYINSISSVTFLAQDPLIRGLSSGVEFTEFRVDPDTSTPFSIYSVPFILAEGFHVIEYRSRDNAGNLEIIKSTGVYVDSAVPSTEVLLTGTTGQNGWYISPVVEVIISSDSLSGVKGSYYKIVRADELPPPATNYLLYSSTVSFAGEGAYTLYYYSVDNVDNVTEVKSIAFKIDLSTPGVMGGSVPVPNPAGWNNVPVSVLFTGTDAVSGIDYCSSSYTLSSEGLGIPVSGYCVDYAGWTSSVSFSVNIDTTPPSSDVGIAAEHGLDGWLLTPAGVTLISTDNLSGVADLSYSIDGSSFALYSSSFPVIDGGTHTLNYYARDIAGNKETEKEFSFKLDLNPPVVSAVSRPLANNYGWNNTAVTAVFAATDTVSGVAYCESEKTVGTEGSSLTIAGYCADFAGWSSTATLTINIDTTAPNLSYIAEPAPNAAGWNNSGVALKFACTDALSGMATCPADIMVVEEEANISTAAVAFDYAGNSKEITASGINIDKTAPQSTSAVSGEYRNGWYSSAVTVVLASTDALSDVKIILYRLEGTSGSGEERVYSEPLIIGANGISKVHYYAEDLAGNREAEKTIELNIDTTAPLVEYTLLPAPNSGAWNSTAVQVVFTGTDTVSEVEECSSDTVVLEGAAQKVVGWCRDLAGNIGYSTATVNLDLTKPVASASQMPGSNESGWNTGPVEVVFTGSDTLSGLAYCEPAKTVSVEGGSQTVSGYCLDNAWNSSTSTIVVNVDLSAPEVSAAGIPPANTAGWNNTPVNVVFAGTDTASGIKYCSSSFTITNEGMEIPVSGYCADYAGWTSTASYTLNIDTTAPSLSYALEPAPNEAGWNNSDVGVKFTCADALSGVKSCPADMRLSGEGQNISTSAAIYDYAGNSKEISAAGVNIDRTTPESTAIISGEYRNGWYSSAASVVLASTDALSGVKRILYRLEGTSVIGEERVYSEPLIIGANGTSKVHYYAEDMAGNMEAEKIIELNIDTTAPLVEYTLLPAPNSGGWNSTAVQVVFIGTDTLSGIEVCSLEIVTVEGGTQKVAGWCRDIAGNIGYSTATVNLDLTKPVVSASQTPSPNGSGWNNGLVEVAFTGSDTLSGLAYCEPAKTISMEGASRTVSGYCLDNAGLVSTASVIVSIDTTSPTLSPVLSPAANSSGWNNTDVTVQFTCTDALSGIGACPTDIVLGGEGVNLSTSAKGYDLAGNMAVAAVAGINIDRAMPVSTAALSGAYRNGYYYAPVTVTILSTDTLSGLANTFYSIDGGEFAEYLAPIEVGAEGHHHIRYYALDKAGNPETAQTLVFDIDSTAPVVSYSIIPLPNAAGWNNSSVIVVFTGTDTLSGIDLCTPGQTVSIEGENQKVVGSCTDLAGNVAYSTAIVSVDTTLPVLEYSRTQANADGWNNTDVLIDFTCSDALSGVVSCPVGITLSSEGVGISTAAKIYDLAGNTIETTVAGIKIDRGLPVSTAELSGSYKNGYYASIVSITLLSTDTLSGVAKTYYSLDGADFTEYRGSIDVGAEGHHTLRHYTKDKAGNKEADKTSEFDIDVTAPEVSYSIMPMPNATGWNNSSAKVAFNGVDALSGLDACTPDQTILIEGANQKIVGSCTDLAGNIAYSTAIVSVDFTVPEVSAEGMPAANAYGWNNTDVLINFTCSDALSGVASCPTGITLSSEGIGISTTTVAYDRAGNPAETTVAGINIDRGLPVSTAYVSGVYSNGYYRSAVSITIVSTDTLSGVAKTFYSLDGGDLAEYQGLVLVGAEGHHTLRYYAQDKAGNWEAGKTLEFNIDVTAPILSYVVIPQPDSTGWNRSSMEVVFTATDTFSGIAACTPAQTVSVEGTNQKVIGSCADLAGNIAYSTVIVNVDFTAPEVSADGTPAANAYGWNNTAVSVAFSGIDAVSGIAYCESTKMASVEGSNQSVSGYCRDYAGLSSTAAYTVNIDTTLPVLGYSRTPANADGWNNTDVLIGFTCSDALSGVASCPAGITLSSEGVGISTAAKAYDRAGNLIETTIAGIQIDRGLPVSIAVLSGHYKNGYYSSNVSITLISTDTLSGVAKTYYSLDGGAFAWYQVPIGVSADGQHILRRYAVDKAGNTESEKTLAFNMDAIPPSVSYAVNPQPNSNGWNKSSVEVTFAGMDSVSGIDSCTPAQTIVIEGEGQAVVGSCTDLAGNIAYSTAIVSMDFTAPVVSAAGAPAANAYGWNKAPVAVVFSGMDAVSGIEYCAPERTAAVEGRNQPVSGYCSDFAGWSSTATLIINIDTTAPSMSYMAEPASNEWGWNKSDVTINFTCADVLSGMASCPTDVAFSSEGVGISTGVKAYDLAGNMGEAIVSGINIDRGLPVSTAALSGMYKNGYYSSAVSISIVSMDTLSGVAKTFYSLDGGDFAEYQGSVEVGAEGRHTLRYHALDKAGNQEADQSVEFNIDVTAPAVSYFIAPLPNTAGWNNSFVTVVFTGVDTLSDIDSCTPAQTVSIEGEGQKVVGSCADLAGNVAYSTAIVSLDLSAPEVSAAGTPAANAYGWNNSSVSVAFNGTDTTSGIAYCESGKTANIEGLNQSVSGYCLNYAGLSSTATYIISIDTTSPVLGYSRTPANADGWNNTDVLIGFTCSDALSGVASCPAGITLSSEGVDISTTANAYDRAGNPVETIVAGIKIDRGLPVSMAVLSGPYKNGYYGSDVSMILISTDTLSGVAKTYYSLDGGAFAEYQVPVSVSADGHHVVRHYAADKAGNTEPEKTLAFNIDAIPPSVSYTANPQPNSNGWNKASVEVVFTGTDSVSGIDSCTPLQTIVIEGGGQTVVGSCADLAGNIAYSTAIVSMDLSAPVVSAVGTPAANTYGWNNTLIAVAFSGEDVVSGIAYCTPEKTADVEGGSQFVSGYCSDFAGWSSTAALVVNIDTTAPSMSYMAEPASNEWGWNKSDVTINFTCADALSGMASCPTYMAFSSEGVGISTGIKAYDLAGNLVEAVVPGINIDRTLPVSTITVAGIYEGGYYSSSVSVNITASDAISGILETEYSLDGGTFTVFTEPFTIGTDGVHSLVYRARDKAGNQENDKVVSIEIRTAPVVVDNTPPNSTISIGSPKIEAFGLTLITPDTPITLSAQDFLVNNSSSGIRDIQYQLVNLRTGEVSTATVYSSSFTLSGQGTFLLKYWSRDNAGNVEAVKEIKLTVSPFLQDALIAVGGLNMSGTGSVTGKVESNATVSLSGNAKVLGDVTAGAIALTGNAQITGQKKIAVALATEPLYLQDFIKNSTTTNNNVLIGSKYIVNGKLVLKGNDSITLSTGTYYFKGLDLSGNSGVTVAGKVNILVAGPVSLGGNSSLNTGGTASSLNIFVSTNSALDISGNGKLAAYIYAPYSALTLGGNVSLRGHYFVKTANISGASAITQFDTVAGEASGQMKISAMSPVPKAGPADEFKLGEVYVFPNPAKGAEAPTFHIETGIADSVKITIYTISGRAAHEQTLTGMPTEIDDGNGLSYAYEYVWRGHIPSGVYLYYIEAQKAGQKLKKTGKFAVVR